MSELAGKGCEIIVPFDERQPLKDIERSIIKKYRKHLWSKFIKAIRDYNLVEEGDKIAVAISGGKTGDETLIGSSVAVDGDKFTAVACAQDVGRILRTFKIKKNVEVTDNGKIII